MTDNTWLSQPAATPYEEPDWLSNWDNKSIHEIIHELAVIRGDLVEQSGRDALTKILVVRQSALLAEAERRGAERGWDEGLQAGKVHAARALNWHLPTPDHPTNPYRKAAQQ